MIPGISHPAGAVPAALASVITCPSCQTMLAVDTSIGLEGPCPICTYYLRAGVPTAPVQPAHPFGGDAPVATGPPAPIKPAPRQVPGGAPRRGIPTARDPVFVVPRDDASSPATGKPTRCRRLGRRMRLFLASPGGQMAGGAVLVLAILGTISCFFLWDHQRSAQQMEHLHPISNEEATTQAGQSAVALPAEDTPLEIPGTIQVGGP